MIERPIMNATTAFVWCTGGVIGASGLDEGVGTTLVVVSKVVEDIQHDGDAAQKERSRKERKRSGRRA